MRYKNSDDNRYRVQFMRSTEELMDQLTVKEFISYLEENAEFEDYTVEYIDKKCVKCRAYDLTEENSKLHKEFLVTEDGRVFYWRSLISKIELVDAEEEKQEVSKMVIKRLKGAKFGTDRIARVVTGYALYEEGKGYIAFSSDRDDAGNCFIWKSTSAFFNIAEGSQVRLRGTVKEHSDYKGTKQTILQRCKVDAVKL